MPLTKRVLLIFIFFMFLGANKVSASCETTPSTTNLLPNSSVNLTVSLKNVGTNPITWIKLPSNYFSVVTLSASSLQESGWTLNTDTGDFIYTNGSLNANDSLHFDITLLTGDERTMDLTWQTSENSSGDPADSCAFSINITSVVPTPTPAPSINSTNLSISNNSATLTWTTSITATGTVNFGSTSGYGSSVTTTSGTSHSATLSGLSASTTYHYQIQVSGEGGTTSSTDATFTTSAANITTTTTTTVTTVSTVIITPTPAPKDTRPPTITLSTDFVKPFLVPPTITGKSTDTGTVNAGVASVEYSLDNGKNWLPVDTIESIGKKSTNFEFTPNGLVDGNYLIKIRAKDITGNTGLSKSYTMVIDRLPPMVGGNLFSLGPMILKPDTLGNIYSIAGLGIKIILSAVGGPTTMDLYYGSDKFTLNYNKESGLWSSEIKTNQTGNLPLLIKSIDGAKNQTEKKLNSIITLSPGKILDENNKPILKAKISVFAYEKTINNYVLWDALPYQETNPQETLETGDYQLILPAGKYFIEVTAPGKRKLRTEIFDLDTATPINQNFYLTNALFWGNFWAKTVSMTVNIPSIQPTTNTNLTNKPIPDFDLSTTDLEFSNTSILGKPSILSFISTWEPQTSDQLLALELFKKENPGINIFAVAVQESSSKVAIYKKTGSYTIPIIADPDGIFVLPLNLGSLPTHIFIDKKGIIKDVNVRYLATVNLLNRILK